MKRVVVEMEYASQCEDKSLVYDSFFLFLFLWLFLNRGFFAFYPIDLCCWLKTQVTCPRPFRSERECGGWEIMERQLHRLYGSHEDRMGDS